MSVCSCDLHRHFRPSGFPLEKRIHEFEQQCLRTVRRLGNRGVHFQSSVKIDLFRDQIIGSLQLRERSGHSERKVRTCSDSIFEFHMSFQIGKNSFRIVVLLTTRFGAELIYILLCDRLCKFPGLDAEIAIQLDFLEKGMLLGRKQDMGSETSHAGNGRSALLNEQLKEILNASVFCLHVQLCEPSFLTCLVCDAARSQDCCSSETRIHFIEKDIPSRCVYKCLELGLQPDMVAAGCDFEIGSVSCALNRDAFEHALKLAGRGQDSGDTLEHTKICMLEGVVSGDRALERIAGLPRSEPSVGINFTGRLGI